MHNLHSKFVKILTIVKQSLKKELNGQGNVQRRGQKPKFSDAEVITLSILSECLMYDSENYLFMVLHKNYKSIFPNLIERSRYNRRRRQLFYLKEKVRQYLVQHMAEGEDTFVIDSMPIQICRFSRAKRIRICRENFITAPDYGYCAAQNSTYLGYKLHGVATINGIITTFDLSKANFHDIEYLKDIKDQYAGCILLGDRAYLSDPLQLELFQEYQLLLNTPMRINQKNYHKQPAVYRRVRKRIETTFSQFCDQFKIQKNYAKTFSGLATRIQAKITGFTLLQFLNKYEFYNQLNHVKHALI
jgi:hypothetical protein